MAELVFPKADGDIYYASEANDAAEIVTVTAAESITAGNVVYIHLTTNQAYVSDTGTANDIRASGIALNSASASGTVKIKKKGIYTTSGLTANTTYYLGASGALSTTRSGVKVGQALSTTQIYIQITQDDEALVGTIKPYVKSFTGLPSNNLTAFWKECDGSSLSDTESALNGQTLPSLNGSTDANKRFLRGSTTSGSTGGADTHSHTVSFPQAVNSAGTAYGNNSGSNGTSSSSNIPPYYEVVFIIKIK